MASEKPLTMYIGPRGGIFSGLFSPFLGLTENESRQSLSIMNSRLSRPGVTCPVKPHTLLFLPALPTPLTLTSCTSGQASPTVLSQSASSGHQQSLVAGTVLAFLPANFPIFPGLNPTFEVRARTPDWSLNHSCGQRVTRPSCATPAAGKKVRSPSWCARPRASQVPWDGGAAAAPAAAVGNHTAVRRCTGPRRGEYINYFLGASVLRA